MQKGFVSVYPDMYKSLKSIKIFQSYDHRCTATFFMNHSVYAAQLEHSDRETCMFLISATFLF